jgi:hypothetical protein
LPPSRAGIASGAALVRNVLPVLPGVKFRPARSDFVTVLDFLFPDYADHDEDEGAADSPLPGRSRSNKISKIAKRVKKPLNKGKCQQLPNSSAAHAKPAI